MRPIEILLSLANLLTFVGLTVPRLRAAHASRYSAVAALPIAGAQALLEGSRWQMFPAYLLSGLLLLAWWRQNREPTVKASDSQHGGPIVGALAIILGAVGLGISTALPLVLPVFRLPQPTGQYAIGTLTYHWLDANRPEIFTAAPNDRREIVVQIWYPAKASPSSPRAPYVPDPRVLAPLLNMLHLPGFLFDHLKYVETHAIPAAPAAEGESTYPVLIFSPGRAGFRQDNTYQIEELVSHGYVVAGVDHPYASSGVLFPDGRLTTIDDRLLPGPPPQRATFADGKFFDEVALRFLARDIIFTLDELTAINQSDPNGVLSGRLDLGRVGMYGPSLGGLIGAEACYLEPRLRALLAMDVHMPADVVRAGLNQPTMLISREAKWMQLEGWTPEYIDQTQATQSAVFHNLAADGYRVLIAGTFHANFADGAFMFGPLSSRLGITGPIDGDRANHIIASYTLAFFNKYLKGLPAGLLEGPSEEYPEVTFETHQR